VTIFADSLRRAVVLRTLGLLIAVASVLGGLGTYLVLRDRSAELRIHQHDAFSMVDLQAETISREAAFVGSDLLYLRHQPSLQQLFDGAPASRERLAAEYLQFFWLRGAYQELRVVDAAGRELVQISYDRGQPALAPAAELENLAGQEFFAKAIQLERDEIYVAPLGSEPLVRFAAPVFDSAGTRRGILVLSYFARRLSAALEDAAAGFHGRLLLLDGRGTYLRGPGLDDVWAPASQPGRTFGADHPEAWGDIANSERTESLRAEGLFASRKVRLTRTARAWLPGDEWIVVAWVGRSELWHDSERFRGRLVLAAAALFPALLGAAWYVSRSSVVRRQNELRIEQSESRLRRLSTELLDAQERERAGISRDLHDDLGQLITSVTLDLERARQAEGERNRQLIDRGLAGARLLLERVHEIASRIRPRILDDLGLHDAVKSHLAQFEDRTGIEVSSELALDGTGVPGVLSENAYRILQEALNNVAKHAQARMVRVVLRATPEQLSLRIRDDGVGFAPDGGSSGLGLLGMRERVNLLGGRLVLRSRPGEGTEIEVDLPIGDHR
jgi:signal transduction histidine kinase